MVTDMQAPVSTPVLALCDGNPDDSKKSMTDEPPIEEPINEANLNQTNGEKPNDSDVPLHLQRLGDALQARDSQKLKATPKGTNKRPACKAGMTSARDDAVSTSPVYKKPSGNVPMKKPGSASKGSPRKVAKPQKQTTKTKKTQQKKMTPKDVYSRGYRAEKRSLF